MGYFAHESSFVDEGAVIGEGTRIWHFSHIMAKACIGPECSIGQNVFVADHVSIGRGVKVQNNVSLYEGVVLEDYTFCGPSMVFTNVRRPRAKFPVTNAAYTETRVCVGATIGANATVVCGIRIGAWALVGAGAVLTTDVPAHALMVGVPARRAGWVCGCSLTLRLVDNIGACACGRTYELRNNELLHQVHGPEL